MKVHLIRVDGTERDLVCTLAQIPGLIRAEVVALIDLGQGDTMIVDGCGGVDERPANMEATRIHQQRTVDPTSGYIPPIFGDAVIVGDCDG